MQVGGDGKVRNADAGQTGNTGQSSIPSLPQRKEMQQLGLIHKNQNKHDFKAKDSSYTALSKKIFVVENKEEAKKDGKAQRFWRPCTIPGMSLSSLRHSGLGTGRVWVEGEWRKSRDKGVELSWTTGNATFLSQISVLQHWSTRDTALPVLSSREVTPPAVPGFSGPW